MSKDTFVKNYDGGGQFMNLPANSYWLLREETILSYLGQRAAKVPKVYLKNIAEHSITLENVGVSFDNLFLKSDNSNSKILFACMTAACKELLRIFELGVLHLDIAARNITKKDGQDINIYILDFSHAICSNYVLEKPIPLLPRLQVQHPDFVNALKEDWKNFFKKNQQSVPDLDQNFDVNNQQFTDYWTNQLAIQNLTNSYSVLCHGLGELLLEISESKVLSSQDKIFLINLGQNLRFNEEPGAKANLEQTLAELAAYQPNESQMYQGGTQIPVVQYQTTLDAEESKSGSTIKKKTPATLPTADTTTKRVQSTINSSQTSHPSPSNVTHGSRLKPIGKLFISWIILLTNFIWLDFVIAETKMKLPDSIIYIILGLLGLIILSVATALFNRNLMEKLGSDIPILTILMQLSITIFIGTKTQGHLITWLPSAICYSAVIILLIHNKIDTD